MGANCALCYTKNKRLINSSVDSKLNHSFSDPIVRHDDVGRRVLPEPEPLSPEQEAAVRNALLNDAVFEFSDHFHTLKLNANSSIASQKRTLLLHEAAAKGKANIVKFLLDKGAITDV